MKRAVAFLFTLAASAACAECIPEVHLVCSMDNAPVEDVFCISVHTNNPTDTQEEARFSLWWDVAGTSYYWPDGSTEWTYMYATVLPGHQWDTLLFVWLPSDSASLDTVMHWQSWLANPDGSVKQVLEDRSYHIIIIPWNSAASEIRDSVVVDGPESPWLSK